MNAIVSTRYGVYIVDIEARKVIDTLRTGDYDTLYYGITFNNEHLLLARRNLCCRTQAIDMFDHNLRYHHTRYFDGLDTHQILYHHGNLYIMSTGTNAIIRVDRNEIIETWHPFPEVKGEDRDHLNSIWFWEDRMYLVAHNKGSSYILTYDANRQLIRKNPAGTGSHNVCLLDNDIAVLSSGRGRVVYENNGYKQIPNRYPRGLAVAGGMRVVGRSEHCTDKKQRHRERRGAVQVYNDQWDLQAEIELESGQVYEVRLLDVPDFAHNSMVWRGKYGS